MTDGFLDRWMKVTGFELQESKIANEVVRMGGSRDGKLKLCRAVEGVF